VERIQENFDIWDFTLSEAEMKKLSSLDMGYTGSRAKHFDPDLSGAVLESKIHD
jgi:diketogulonate reductase-like aldo/keto reductase